MSDDISTADLASIKNKYVQEREKRLRTDGISQFIEVAGEFQHFAEDPHSTPVEREPLHEEVEVLVVGAGFGGMLAAARLRETGIESLRILDKAGDFGGTWYWNRYPGAQCDVESYIYLPLLEELGYVPTEKYAYADEIRDHVARIADHYRLRQAALFHTQAVELHWDEGRKRWQVTTDRGDQITAQFVVTASGPLNRPKLPGVPGIKSFKGKIFHTSRWDYDYTGGNEKGGLTGLTDKRVGIIGTGATAIQIVPHVARDAKELFVFQRTPSGVDERNNRPTDPEWFESLQPGWQRERQLNFDQLTWGQPMPVDLVSDGWTDKNRRVTERLVEIGDLSSMTAEKYAALEEQINVGKMNEIRARAESIVEDPATAEALKPWYRFFCKRPCFHDEYLQAFNHPGTHLVDTDGKGVDRITERGVVVDGTEYELDCLIFATGFEVGTDYTRRSGFKVFGREGKSLDDHWGDEYRTLHGYITDGFPNLFILSKPQAPSPYNFSNMLDLISQQVAWIVDRVRSTGKATVEPDSNAVDAWVETILGFSSAWEQFVDGCTPGYYNGEGLIQFNRKEMSRISFLGGPTKYYELIEKWREDGAETELVIGG